jgi:hypothetical protein
MIRRFLLAATVALAGAGVAFAEHPCSCPVEAPTTPMAPLRLFRVTPPGTVEVPGSTIAAPVLFRKEIEPPVWTVGQPRPPLVLFRSPPPDVPVFNCPPPQVDLFRLAPTPPVPMPDVALPPIRVFPRTPECPTWGPTIRQAPLRVWTQPSPPYPVECPSAGERGASAPR